MPESKNRWYQFSLATMLVMVAVFGILLGWMGRGLKAVKERRDFLSLVRAQTAAEEGPVVDRISSSLPPLSPTPGKISFWRQWLGDEAVYCLDLPPSASREMLERARTLFPESQIFCDL